MKRSGTIQRVLSVSAIVLAFAMANSRLVRAGWIGIGHRPYWATAYDRLPPALFPDVISLLSLERFWEANLYAALCAVLILLVAHVRFRHAYLLLLPVIGFFGQVLWQVWPHRSIYALGTGRALNPVGLTWLALLLLCCTAIAGMRVADLAARQSARRAILGVACALVLGASLLLALQVGGSCLSPRFAVLAAADRQDWDRVGSLVSRKPSLALVCDSYGTSLLHAAAEAGAEDVAELLIRSGADVNSGRGFEKRTPLHVACKNGRTGMVRLLLKHGADVAANPDYYGTPLHQAARWGTVDLVRLLLTQGAEVNTSNSYGHTPLRMAAAGGVVEVAELLLEAGAAVDSRSDDGSTPLYSADSAEVVRLLVRHGAELSARDKRGQTPLAQALQMGRIDVARELVALGADINTKDVDGRTPLHDSAYGPPRSRRFLLDAGADVRVRERTGRTPLHEAETAMAATALIGSGADIHAQDEYGETPLLTAAAAGRRDVVDVLIRHGADPRHVANGGFTPLHSAALMGGTDPGHAEVVELLIQAGADVNAKTDEGETPLNLAILSKKQDVAEVLRRHGATTGGVKR